MNDRTLHGVLSLLLFAGAAFVAVCTAWLAFGAAGLLYLLFLPDALFVAVMFFCRKCPGREACPHLLPRFFTRLLPAPDEQEYRGGELAIVGSTMLFWLGMPLFWVFSFPPWAAAYAALVAAGVFEIRRFLCRGCDNPQCPLRRPPAP